MRLQERLERENTRLTPRERDLAAYILAEGAELAFESASSIARRNGTSAATVVRLFAKLGYSGYAEVQAELRANLSERLASPAARSEARSGAVPTLRDIIETSKASAIGNIETTFDGIDIKEFDSFIKQIASNSGKLFVMGERYSYSAAHILVSHLNLCRNDVVLLDTGASMAPDRQMWVTARDLLLCISLRRYARATLATAEYFSALGATVASITDSPLAPVTRLSDYRLLVSSGGGIFDNHTALVCMVHIIIEAVAARLKGTLRSSLPRADKLWAHHMAFVEK